MRFRYEQSTGRFLLTGCLGTRLIARGYAGAKGGRNNPALEHLQAIGPIPKGSYSARIVQHARFAHPAIYLDPAPSNHMFGRSGFFIHGDNAKGDGSASTGCIILGRGHRLEVARLIEQGVRILDVVA